MIAKKIVAWIIVLLGLSVVLFFGSCASTNQGGAGYDEELLGDDLGSIDDDVLSDLDASSDEAEVLRLLGISNSDSEFSNPPASGSTTGANNSTDLSLDDKVKKLEDETRRKDIEMSNLRAEIAERDKRLQDLQTQTAQPVKVSSVSNTFKDSYEDALASYRERKYKVAIQKFDNLLLMDANNSLVDNCQYWRGECYYALGDYNQAILEFQKVFTYNSSNKLDDAQLKLGLCYLKLGNKERSRSEFDKLISNYPDSEFISRAESYISRL